MIQASTESQGGDCSTIAAEVEHANQAQQEADQIRAKHLHTAQSLRASAQDADLTATTLVRAHRDRRASYTALRRKLKAQIKAASAEVARYKQLRGLAVQYQERCQQKKVTECEPGPEGTPLCHEVIAKDSFCEYAQKYAKLAAQHASSVGTVEALEQRLDSAAREAAHFVRRAAKKITAAHARQHTAHSELEMEEGLLQEAVAHSQHAHRNSAELMRTHQLCRRLLKQDQDAAARLRAADLAAKRVEALPAAPWKLSEQQKLAVR